MMTEEQKNTGQAQEQEQSDKSADETEREFMESYYGLSTEQASKDVKGYSKA